jgi:hypothetical protein
MILQKDQWLQELELIFNSKIWLSVALILFYIYIHHFLDNLVERNSKGRTRLTLTSEGILDQGGMTGYVH